MKISNAQSIQEKIIEIGILPVIKLKNIDDALDLAEALVAGNMPAAEVTFRAEGADLVIKAMLDKYPDMIVGAGTVLTIQQVEKALNAGAKFIVSPGYDEEIVSYCVEKGVAVFPGCVTPTEILKALKHGLNVIKFFPAEQYGGLATINALAGPFGGVKFMPTGGISLSNLADFVSNKNIAACGGSFMVADKYINDKNWAEITKICAEAIEIIRKARG